MTVFLIILGVVIVGVIVILWAPLQVEFSSEKNKEVAITQLRAWYLHPLLCEIFYTYPGKLRHLRICGKNLHPKKESSDQSSESFSSPHDSKPRKKSPDHLPEFLDADSAEEYRPTPSESLTEHEHERSVPPENDRIETHPSDNRSSSHRYVRDYEQGERESYPTIDKYASEESTESTNEHNERAENYNGKSDTEEQEKSDTKPNIFDTFRNHPAYFAFRQKHVLKPLIRWLLRVMGSFFRLIVIKKPGVVIKMGFEDNALTGMVYGYVSTFNYLVCGTKPCLLTLEPVFGYHGIVAWNGTGSARTSLARLLNPLAIAIFTFPYLTVAVTGIKYWLFARRKAKREKSFPQK